MRKAQLAQLVCYGHSCDGSEIGIRNHSPPFCVFLLSFTNTIPCSFFSLHLLFFLWLLWAPFRSTPPESSHPLTKLQLLFSGSALPNLYVHAWAAISPSQVTSLLTSQARDLNVVFDCIIPLTRFLNSPNLRGHKPKMVLVFFRLSAFSGTKLNFPFPPLKTI